MNGKIETKYKLKQRRVDCSALKICILFIKVSTQLTNGSISQVEKTWKGMF